MKIYVIGRNGGEAVDAAAVIEKMNKNLLQTLTYMSAFKVLRQDIKE